MPMKKLKQLLKKQRLLITTGSSILKTRMFLIWADLLMSQKKQTNWLMKLLKKSRLPAATRNTCRKFLQEGRFSLTHPKKAALHSGMAGQEQAAILLFQFFPPPCI